MTDEALDAFLNFSERHGCRYHPRKITRHQAPLRRAVEAVARSAARELGIDVPQVRWFYDSNVRWSGEPLELRGLAITAVGTVFINLDLPNVAEARCVTAHEVAHIAGHESEDAADAFALRFMGEHYPFDLQRAPQRTEESDVPVWWGNRAAWSGMDLRGRSEVGTAS